MSEVAEGLRIDLSGVVQGVGFRPWLARLAAETGVTGRVANGTAGVTIEIFGGGVDTFVTRLRSEAPTAARIDTLITVPIAAPAPSTFTIATSAIDAARRLSIPPDLATCSDCLREIADPTDRRYRYAFTSCTACGPRFSIATSIPYDRATTTMAAFVLCRDCRREYESAGDRRFHAQPNACAVCGPQLTLLEAEADAVEGDCIANAAARLCAGDIVMVKGLGGFHLACDATSQTAVLRLRARKAREEKPFAVMVASLAAARRLAAIDDDERRLLEGVERPIVLVRAFPGAVAPAVAPDAARLGIMLPYTPLHHLLLDAVDRPLVMTSANLSDEPTAFRDEEARRLIGSVADAFLTHDRPIAQRVDDSVTAVLAGAPVLLRRSRGWVPRAVRLSAPVPEPVLALGAQLKNTFCLALDDVAYLGPHIGDLDSWACYESLGDAIARFEEMLGVHPEIVAHDLHPDLLSTRFARERGGRLVAVQHHHAHAAAALAEHGLEGPALAIAFDGMGFGSDGAAWGGEILVADRRTFRRVATLRPMILVGGDRALREPWRVALALLDDAFDGAPPLDSLPLFLKVEPSRLAQVRALIHGPHAPRAHGAGRLFDGLAALVLARPTAAYEAQLAMALEQMAAPDERAAYPYAIDKRASVARNERLEGPHAGVAAAFVARHERGEHAPPGDAGAIDVVDTRPLVRAATTDLLDGTPPRIVAARIHNTIAAFAAAALPAASCDLPVVLTGGCFQNVRLASETRRRLADRQVLLHRQVPPNDGGIALGQAWISAALTRDPS